MCGPLLPCLLGDLYVMPVLWAGMLIGLSVCGYGLDRPYLGATAGVAAVFFRELALPYCLLGMPWLPGSGVAANCWSGWRDWRAGRASSPCTGCK